MKTLIWLALLGIFAGLGYAIWVAIRKYGERQRAAEERFASFMAQTAKPGAPKLEPLPAAPKPAPASLPPAAPAATMAAELAPQRLLLEAAAKAGQAGEPALSIQLYERLIARYPEGAFAAQARTAADALKSMAPKP